MKRRKVEPATLSLQFSTPSVTANQREQFFIDLSQCVSLMNRRFYRQGLNWAVAGIKVTTSGDGVITTQKLPSTWTMSNAWHKGFAMWQKMNREAMEEAESVKPRFLDFKIYANARHHNKGFDDNLLPISISTDPAGATTAHTATPGEWESSKVVIPAGPGGPGIGATNSRELIAVGPSYPGAGAAGPDAVSLIEGYASSRGLPEILDPNTPDDADSLAFPNPENWMAAIFNEGTGQTQAVLDDMTSENNQAPYPFENAQVPGAAPGTVFTDTQYPGGANQLQGLEIHDLSFITPTTIGGTTRIAGGQFPCGLMAFTWEPTSTSNIAIQLDLVPGPHRGYLALPMQEM